ncbi:MAG: O-methyltransferase [Bacteroidota bacterium]
MKKRLPEGSGLYDETLEAYCTQHSSAEPPWLTSLQRLTFLRHTHGRQMSGHLQGRFLSLLSKMVKPSLVLDIGTFTGYSALCFAEGLAPGGKVITIEADEENETLIREAIHSSPYASVVQPVIANALEWLEKHPEIHPDLVFLDADKRNYPHYLNKLIPMMLPGSLLLADNTLWNGKVVDPQEREDDVDTRTLHRFNAVASSHAAFDTVLLPLRDGLTLMRRR